MVHNFGGSVLEIYYCGWSYLVRNRNSTVGSHLCVAGIQDPLTFLNKVVSVNTEKSNSTSISIQIPTLTIIPNPSNDTWQIRIQLPKRERGTIQIHNLAGQELMSREISGKENMITVDLKDYQPGIYICSYMVDGKVVVSKKGVVE